MPLAPKDDVEHRNADAERVLDAGLTLVAKYNLDAQARVLHAPDGPWMLELPQGRSEIGTSFTEARDALTILIRESRR